MNKNGELIKLRVCRMCDISEDAITEVMCECIFFKFSFPDTTVASGPGPRHC